MPGGNAQRTEPMRKGELRMPRLHLLRHAKSSWKEEVEDKERPLNKRGSAAAALVARHLQAAVGPLDLILCSNSRRTRQTLDLILPGFTARPRCLVEDELYLADCASLVDRLKRLDDTLADVMLIAHNPGIQDLATALVEPDSPGASAFISGKFVTCARASFDIRTRWRALGDTRHRLLDYVAPASLARGDNRD
jgi:phosphohistidine phosphatase